MGNTHCTKTIVTAGLGVALLAGGVVAPVNVYADDPAIAFASEQTALIEANSEETLNAAVESVRDGVSTEIKLTASIQLAETLTIPSGKSIVLNLNGKTLSCAVGKNVIGNYGNLAVKNGTVAVTENGSGTEGCAVYNHGSESVLVVDQEKGFSTKLIGRSGITSEGAATVNAGVIESYNRNAYWGKAGSKLVVNDGEFLSSTGSSGYGRAISTEGIVEIYGGSFKASGSSGAGDNYMNAISMFNSGSLLIKPSEGKNVIVESETDYAVSSYNGATVKIYGGSFACNGARTDVKHLQCDDPSVIQIYGGSFKHEPSSAYLPTGYVVENADNSYNVFQAQPTEDVVATSYEQLKAYASGSILTPKNISLSGNVVIPKGETLHIKKGYSINVPANSSFKVEGVLKLDGGLANHGLLEFGDESFVENVLKISNDGTVSGVSIPDSTGVCAVETPMELQWISWLVENGDAPAKVVLAGDIAIPSDAKFTPIANKTSLNGFTFNGMGHSISNLQIEVSDEYRGGLFGYLKDSTVRNLTISGKSTNSTSSYIGALAGYISGSCSIVDVHISGYEVKSPVSYGVGGFVGQINMANDADRCEFIGCSIDANITGYANVGGFWGTSTGSKGTVGIYNSTLSGTTINTLSVNGAACGGYGSSVKVEVIGLNRSGITCAGKTSESALVAYTETQGSSNIAYADADKYEAVKGEDGAWTQAEKGGTAAPAVYVDGVGVASFRAAIDAAEEGSLVSVAREVDLGEDLAITKKVRVTGFGNVKVAEGKALTISAGTYDADPSGFLTQGCACEKDGDAFVVFVPRTVTLDVSGGSLPEAVQTVLKTNREGRVSALPVPTRSGYTFDGWYTLADGGEIIDAATVFSADATIYAHWTSVPTPPSGGGGSTSDKTDVEQNQDGSTTTTVTKPDGSQTITHETATGTESVVKKDKDGNVTSTEVSVSKQDAESGKVELPIEKSEPAADASKASEVEVKVPSTVTADKPVQVTVPVAKAEGAEPNYGVVVFAVDEDGNETLIPKTAVDDDGNVVFEAAGDVTIKVVDNAKDMPDVTDADWFAGGVVDFATARGIVNGVEMPDGSKEFQGYDGTSRGMLVAMLHNLELNPEAASAESLPDVPEGAFYADAAAWALGEGILSGVDMPDGTKEFQGDAPVTREQVAVFLMRYAESLGMDVSKRAEIDFPDAGEVSGFAKDAMSWAVAEGLFKGNDATGELNPTDGAARAEVAAVLMRFINLMYA